jgi:hypothetical protein
VIGALTAAAGLLVAAGIAKFVRPDGTAGALGHRRTTAVRTGAAAEVLIGGAALLRGGAVAWLVAASYVAFAGYIAVAIARGWSLSSCGCFGQPDTPRDRAPVIRPTRLHLVVDLGLGAAAATAARAPSPIDAVAAHPANVIVQLTQGAVIGGLAYLILARLPPLQAARLQATLRR